jgi:uncharacterized protein (TIGR02598 family)
MMKDPSRSTSPAGFTLVEIMIALGVIALGLIAVVGLIPQGLQASRDAADNTMAATIVQDTFSTLRQQALVTFPPSIPAQPLYYDEAGTNQVPKTSPFCYYQVHLAQQSTANLVNIAATVMWPFNPSLPSVPPLNTNVYVTTIANYQH